MTIRSERKAFARLLFETYVRAVGGKNIAQQPIPDFDTVCETQPQIAFAWETVGEKARELLSQETIPTVRPPNDGAENYSESEQAREGTYKPR